MRFEETTTVETHEVLECSFTYIQYFTRNKNIFVEVAEEVVVVMFSI